MWPSPFQPLTSKIVNGTAVNIAQVAPLNVAATTTASAVVALPGNTSGDGQNCDIRIENQGIIGATGGFAMCNFGDGTQGAATLLNGIGVPPGQALVVRVDPTCNSVSVILSAGATAAVVRFTRGIGLD